MDGERASSLERARREERPVRAAGGDTLGRLEAIYYDLERGDPEWLGVAAEGGEGRRLVPVAGAAIEEDAVRVPYGREQVEASPAVDEEEIGEELEEAIRVHYGLPRPLEERDTSVVESEDRDPTLVRHEERVEVGKRQVETGRVRLRKRVEAEPVTVDVELVREVARVVRQPVGVEVEGVELGEQVLEIPLYAERPVVEKRVVAAERIAVEKDVERTVETVSEERRVERVDVDEDAT
jgi:stress response protein YsnF